MQLITFGHPKHGRVDLKQFLISLMVSSDGRIPLLAQAIAGNTSDHAHFKAVLKTLQTNIKNGPDEFYVVLDAAFYSAEAVNLNVLWISRVPEKIKEAAELKKSFLDQKGMCDAGNGYKFAEVESNYGGVTQRWFIVYSKKAHERVRKTILRRVEREKEEAAKILKKLQSMDYACPEDALKAINSLKKKFKYHEIQLNAIEEDYTFSRAGRPTAGTPKKYHYIINATIIEKNNVIQKAIMYKSMFVLATNQVDTTKLSGHEVLSHYKEQHFVEGGFRFIKDPLCMASAVYLKNDARIIALAMIMCLCLLVYALAERQLRRALKQEEESVPNQIGKPTVTPTRRWVFQMFEGVIITTIKIDEVVHHRIVNFSNTLQKIIRLLGPDCMRIYLVSSG